MLDVPPSRAYTSSSAAVVRSDSMAEPTTLDELDVKILRLLNADARKSYRDIAKATDASISTISSRVRKLEMVRSEEHTSELQSLRHLVCRLLLENKN